MWNDGATTAPARGASTCTSGRAAALPVIAADAKNNADAMRKKNNFTYFTS
jgi:hypothetical protein